MAFFMYVFEVPAGPCEAYCISYNAAAVNERVLLSDSLTRTCGLRLNGWNGPPALAEKVVGTTLPNNGCQV